MAHGGSDWRKFLKFLMKSGFEPNGKNGNGHASFLYRAGHVVKETRFPTQISGGRRMQVYMAQAEKFMANVQEAADAMIEHQLTYVQGDQPAPGKLYHLAAAREQQKSRAG